MILTTYEITNLSKPKNIASTQRPVDETEGSLIQTILGNLKYIYIYIYIYINEICFSCFVFGTSGERHLCISCDGCQRKPIIGSRWHCKTCPNYDLCTQCYMTDCHPKGHTFERIDKSRGKG